MMSLYGISLPVDLIAGIRKSKFAGSAHKYVKIIVCKCEKLTLRRSLTKSWNANNAADGFGYREIVCLFSLDESVVNISFTAIMWAGVEYCTIGNSINGSAKSQ